MHQIDPMQEEKATGIFTQTEGMDKKNIMGSTISAAWNYLASQRACFSKLFSGYISISISYTKNERKMDKHSSSPLL